MQACSWTLSIYFLHQSLLRREPVEFRILAVATVRLTVALVGVQIIRIFPIRVTDLHSETIRIDRRMQSPRMNPSSG